jgi:hypothetical protein
MVTATVDLQFLPQGDVFGYDPKESAADQSARLKTILAACDDLKLIFNGLLPPEKRTWWDDLDLKVVGGQVPTDTIVSALNGHLADCKQTAAEFAAIAADLPTTMSLATSTGGSFPAPGAHEYSVAVPDNGVRCYYLTPKGVIQCCLAATLKVDGNQSLLAYNDMPDGFFKVMMTVHFTVPAVA